MMSHIPSATRYDHMPYHRCGRSGLLLPAISLGLWHNFGSVDVFENGREMILGSFDLGITHFDLAKRRASLRAMRRWPPAVRWAARSPPSTQRFTEDSLTPRASATSLGLSRASTPHQ